MTLSKGNWRRPSGERLSTPGSSRAVTSPHPLHIPPTRLAASRMEVGPVPHRVLSNSHRFAVKTCHSNSGVAKAIRASVSPFPDFMARDASARVSAKGDRKANRTDRTAATARGNLASKEEALQGQRANRRGLTGGEAGSKLLLGRAPGWLAAWLGAAYRGHDHDGCRTWRVACATRRRDTATTAPAGRRRTRVAVGPGRPRRVGPRRAGRPRRAARGPG